jgi:hypothetical protein
LRIFTEDRHIIVLPVGQSVQDFPTHDDGTVRLVRVSATQKAEQRSAIVTEVRFHCVEINRTIRFVLDGFAIPQGESGLWTVSVRLVTGGSILCDLEYYRANPPLMMRWNHDKNEMDGC